MYKNVRRNFFTARRMSTAIKFRINQRNFSPSTRQRNRSAVNPPYLETKGRLIVDNCNVKAYCAHRIELLKLNIVS
ncbi:hypothetical protein PUN28_018129 [Cardiocondyla obscurior]|uniref:Uncharacterized protein n=1 Tax=Cardiocondyla obscurior TaxID=286306 RepID=A0AAW2EHH0_9HYME